MVTTAFWSSALGRNSPCFRRGGWQRRRRRARAGTYRRVEGRLPAHRQLDRLAEDPVVRGEVEGCQWWRQPAPLISVIVQGEEGESQGWTGIGAVAVARDGQGDLPSRFVEVDQTEIEIGGVRLCRRGSRRVTVGH